MDRILKIVAIAILVMISSNKALADEYGIHAVVISDEFTGKFVNPTALFYDDVKSRLYVADSGNGRLISFDSNLEFLSQWVSDKVVSPVSLVKNTQGKFYVLDSSDQKVKYVDPQVGLVRALGFKDVPKAKSRFFPGRIAIDSNDSLYIIDKMNKRIVVLDSEEKYVKSLTVEGKKHGKLYGFNDVAVSKSGVIVAVDTIGRSVFIFNSSGTVRKRFGGPAYKKGGGSLFFPVSLSIDKFDNIYILDSHMGKILAYSKDGNLKFTVSSRGFDKGSLHDPVHVILDDKRRLYTLESGRVQILKRVNE